MGNTTSHNQSEQALFIKPEEIAEIAGLSVSATYAGLRSGQIPNKRVGRRYIVSRRTFMQWFYGSE